MPKLSQFRLLALGVGGISLLGLILGLSGLNGGVPAYVAVAGLALAVGIALPVPIGAFLRFFIVFYGAGFIALMSLLVVAGWLPAGATAWLPSPLVAFQAAAFGLIAAVLARLPLMVRIFAITDPYFETKDRRPVALPGFGGTTAPERWIAYLLLGTIIVINLAQVGLTVRLNQFNRDFYDALQNKNEAEFWRQLLQIWVPVISIWILSNIVEIVLVGNFRIRWREWLTHRLTGRWLDDGVHYRLQFNGGVDNPDQRIQEDIKKYVDNTYALTIQMIQQISTLVSFSVILWGLSTNLPIPGTETVIPGMLFWVALIYAGIGTWIAHRIGRRLIALNFTQEHYEANFRYMLARLREFNEPVALLRGENSEKTKLKLRFDEVFTNYLRIIGVQKWLNAFSSFYGASNSIVPLVVLAPFYFLNKVTLGVLIQTATAFDRVNTAFSFIIDRYSTLAEYKAVIDRLTTFESTIDQTKAQRASSRITQAEASARDLRIPKLSLALPDGRVIARVDDLVFARGERTLLVGPSGSGKSTLFRAVAGIWPFGDGVIEKPAGKSLMLLPQRPYIPIGTLKGAVSYPAIEGAHDEAAMMAALDLVRLPQLRTRLSEEANWSQILSGGEQQRLAVARALLAKPDWLFLDEATSALDEPLEDAVYSAIRTALPDTTIISIGHRSSLMDNHDRRIAMEMTADGLFRIVEARVPA